MFYVGQWRWDSINSEWIPPEGCVSALDLRRMSDQASRTAGGKGLFICHDVAPVDCDLIAKNWDQKSNARMRSALRIGRRMPAGDDLLGILINLLTDASDLDGETGLKPIVPDARMQLHFKFGARRHVVRMRGLGDGHGERVRALIEKDLDSLPEEKQAQALGFELRKYGLKDDDWKAIVKDKRRQKRIGRPRKPETTLTDDFERADEDPIASPWVELEGTDFKILSGNVQKDGSTLNSIVYSTPLSGSDQECVVDPQGTSNTMGPLIRCQSTSVATYYSLYPINIAAVRIYKTIATTRTQIATGSVASLLNVPYKLTVSGSAQEALIDGSSTCSATDTSISSGLYAGISGLSASKQLMDWTASDIGGTPGLIYTQLESTPRGVMRGVFHRAQR